jgi:predicted sulfurtransferase
MEEASTTITLKDDYTTRKEGKTADQSRRREKKRLSRKEQKARKKKKLETHASSKELHPPREEENASNAPAIQVEDEVSDKVTAQNDEQDYDANYVPTPRPVGPHKSQKQSNQKSLGKWFPKAVVLKSLAPPSNDYQASIVLFYQYVNPLWPESYLTGFISYLCQIAETRCLGGRIRVAREGVNATLSSRDTRTSDDNGSDHIISAQQTLRHFARDLQGYHEVFQQTDFKYIDNLKGDRHFKDFKVFPVQELVFYGLPSDKTMGNVDLGSLQGGVHLSAQEFHKKLTDPETVVVDVRNHYESMLGRFDGQQHVKAKDQGKHASGEATEVGVAAAPQEVVEGDTDDKAESSAPAVVNTDAVAEYIDPRMRKSTDWTRWLEQDDTKAKLEGKQVLLYCTGTSLRIFLLKYLLEDLSTWFISPSFLSFPSTTRKKEEYGVNEHQYI